MSGTFLIVFPVFFFSLYNFFYYKVRCVLVVRISGFHPDGPGSNPGIGAKLVMDGPWEEENKICYVDPPCEGYIVGHKIK